MSDNERGRGRRVRSSGRGAPLLVIALMGAVTVPGCLPEDQATRTADMREVAERLGPDLMARLDSANEAFGENDFEAASALYRSIAEDAPDESVGWFGVFMAEQALGNAEAADSALEQARRAAPGASLLRPDTTAPDVDGQEES